MARVIRGMLRCIIGSLVAGCSIAWAGYFIWNAVAFAAGVVTGSWAQVPETAAKLVGLGALGVGGVYYALKRQQGYGVTKGPG